MKISPSIEHATLSAKFNFTAWLEKKYVDELRQMTFSSPVGLEVEALIREFDARTPDNNAQVSMPL